MASLEPSGRGACLEPRDERGDLLGVRERGAERHVELAAALGFKYKKIEGGEFSHSNLITVMDQEGKIRHQQSGLKKDPKQTIDTIVSLVK